MKFKNVSNKIFAENMRIRRKELKLSQEKLGELCGLHRTYIGGIEQQNRNPSMKSMEKIANALKIDLALLANKNYKNINTKYTLCVLKDNKYNFYPIDEKSLSQDQIKFLETLY